MSLRHGLLGLLAERTASGYDLVKLFNTSLAEVWPATQSQVYGELTQLCGAGMIEVVAHGPRGRKEYGITDQGRAELRRWLSETRPEQQQRNEGLLRVFFLGVLPRQEAVDRLVEQAETAARRRAALLALQDSVDWGDDMLSVNGRLALEYGLRLRAMEEEWARWAAAQIAATGKQQ